MHILIHFFLQARGFCWVHEKEESRAEKNGGCLRAWKVSKGTYKRTDVEKWGGKGVRAAYGQQQSLAKAGGD